MDDEEAVADTLTAILRHEGHEVVMCDAIPRALELIGRETFDVLLTDLRVQGMDDGLTAIAAAKASDPDVVAILLTGYVTAQSAIEAVRLGAWAYLTKPCNLEELRLTIRKGLEHRAQLADLRREAAAAEAARAQAEAARDWMKLVIDAMPHGVAIADASGQLLMCNAACFASWGHGASADGRPKLNYGRPDGGDYDRSTLPLGRALRGETVQTCELSILNRGTGEVRQLLVSASPIQASDGSQIGAVSVCQDVTELARTCGQSGD